MNGTGDGGTPPPSNQGTIKIVVLTVAINSTLCIAALGFCMVMKVQPDPVLLTAFVGLTSGLVGYLGGMLGKTTPTNSTPATQDVKVMNPPNDPANVEVQAQNLT